jgi:anti-sigma B factor antagonist
MKCYEVTKCGPKDREGCFVWNNYRTTPQDLENVKCWILKDGCSDGNEAQQAKCRGCGYYRILNQESGIAFQSEADYAVISCEGSLNNERNKALKKVWQTLKSHGKNRILLDLSKTENIYSSGLGTIITIHKETKEAGGLLVVVCNDEYIKNLFTVAKLSRIVSIMDNMRDAHDAFVAHRELLKKKTAPIAAPREAPRQEQAPKVRPACHGYWKNKNPQNATNCDECSKKIKPTSLPCWIVDGMIEGISFQYVNEDCGRCRYFEEFGTGAAPAP